jgi:hypothetical protein
VQFLLHPIGQEPELVELVSDKESVNIKKPNNVKVQDTSAANSTTAAIDGNGSTTNGSKQSTHGKSKYRCTVKGKDSIVHTQNYIYIYIACINNCECIGNYRITTELLVTASNIAV